MDKTTNSSNSQNLIHSNKKAIDFTFFIIIILILISTFASAKTRYGYYQRNKKSQTITVGIQSGLVQRTMTYNLNNYQQKYLELAHRLTIVKKVNKGLSVELGMYNSFTNNAPNTNYSFSDNNRVISLSSIYHVNVLPKVCFEPKIGLGVMFHHDHQYNEDAQLETYKSRMEILQLGGMLRLQLNDYFSIGGGGDLIIGNKNHIMPYAYTGIYVNLTKDAAAKYRRCPSKF